MGNQYDQRSNGNSNNGRDSRGGYDDRRPDTRDRGRDERDDRDDHDDQGNEQGEQDRSRLIPEGRFRGRRIAHEFAWAGEGNKKKEQLAVQFEFIVEPVKGRTLTWYGYFTDKAIETTFKAMRAMEWQGNDPNAGWPSKEESEKIEVELVVQHERNQHGDWIARIRWVNGGGVAVKNVMNDAEKATFSQKMTGIAARLAAKTGGAPSGNGGGDRQLRDTRGNDEPPPPNDDDAPPFNRNRGGGRDDGRRRT